MKFLCGQELFLKNIMLYHYHQEHKAHVFQSITTSPKCLTRIACLLEFIQCVVVWFLVINCQKLPENLDISFYLLIWFVILYLFINFDEKFAVWSV